MDSNLERLFMMLDQSTRSVCECFSIELAVHSSSSGVDVTPQGRLSAKSWVSPMDTDSSKAPSPIRRFKPPSEFQFHIESVSLSPKKSWRSNLFQNQYSARILGITTPALQSKF